jgi:hypothetical protein
VRDKLVNDEVLARGSSLDDGVCVAVPAAPFVPLGVEALSTQFARHSLVISEEAILMARQLGSLT